MARCDVSKLWNQIQDSGSLMVCYLTTGGVSACALNSIKGMRILNDHFYKVVGVYDHRITERHLADDVAHMTKRLPAVSRLLVN